MIANFAESSPCNRLTGCRKEGVPGRRLGLVVVVVATVVVMMMLSGSPMRAGLGLSLVQPTDTQ